jgi:hypothetical protein
MTGKSKASFNSRFFLFSLWPKRQLVFLSLLPKVGDAFWIGLFSFVLQIGNKLMNGDGDLGRHITIGSYILDSGNIPTVDIFSHTMYGEQLVPHEWLSQLLFALFYRWSGFPGVILLCGFVITISFWLVFQNSKNASNSLFPSVFVTLLIVFTSLLHWLSRSHIFTFLLLALWMFELRSLSSNSDQKIYRRWWVFPLSMILWVNLHGAFIAGFVTWALYGIGMVIDIYFIDSGKQKELESQKRLWFSFFLIGGTSFISTFLNPSGFNLWSNSFGYVANKFLVDMTIEYRSPDFHILSAQPFLFIIGLFIVLLGIQRCKIPSSWLIVTAAWLVMGLYSARNIPLFAIVSAPALSSLMRDLVGLLSEKWSVLRRLLKLDLELLQVEKSTYFFIYPMLAIFFAVYTIINGNSIGISSSITFDSDRFPVDAANWLDEFPQAGRMFNEFAWGGYLLYRQWPDQPVFIDGQTDFYGEDLTRQYLRVRDFQEGWEHVLDQYQVTWIIIPTKVAFARELHEHPGWKSIYQDSTAEIFIKNH